MKQLDLLKFYCPTQQELTAASQTGGRPKTMDYICGGCGLSTHGRVVADSKVIENGAKIGDVAWTFCDCGQPTAFIITGPAMQQYPAPIEFRQHPAWPSDLAKLFMEASLSLSSCAFTASAMVSRKVLMACAVREGAADGEPFNKYVDYIVNTVLTMPRARTAIDAIRKIGNDANHDVAFVSGDDARRAISIVEYLLNTVYSIPKP